MPKRKRAGSNNLADQTCPTRSKTQARVPNVPASAEEKDKCIQELMDGLKHVKDDLKRSEATQNDLKAAHAKQLAEKDAEANPRGSVSAGAGAGAAGWALGACGHLSCERERASATTTTTATKNNKTPLWRARALVKYLNVLLRERAIMSTQTGAQSATPRTHTARAIRQLVQTSRCAASQTCSMPDAHSAMRRRARSALSRRRLRTRFRQTS